MGIRCDPPLSGRQDGSVHLHRTRPALRDPSVGVLSDVGHRADVRSARLLPAICKDYEDKQQRFIDESTRLLGILDRRLEGRDWIVDDYSIADIATLGWVNALVEFYAAGDILGLSSERPRMAWTRAGSTGRPAWPPHSREASMSIIAPIITTKASEFAKSRSMSTSSWARVARFCWIALSEPTPRNYSRSKGHIIFIRWRSTTRCTAVPAQARGLQR